MDQLLTVFERVGMGAGFGVVCMYFYRKDVLQREQMISGLLTECMTVIRENTKIIAEHTSMIKAYMEGDSND